ncbi:hypothetical protein GJV44_00028 [Candidatus Vallotia cooleyia]|nr:hypothetical protein GJV44_00028 [Candidatus Vallotia cooleyia]
MLNAYQIVDLRRLYSGTFRIEDNNKSIVQIPVARIFERGSFSTQKCVQAATSASARLDCASTTTLLINHGRLVRYANTRDYTRDPK